MTREEFAKQYVDSLSNEQCRELLTIALLGILPGVFLAVEKATTPGWGKHTTSEHVIEAKEYLHKMTAQDLYHWHNPQICATCRLCEYIADSHCHICMLTRQPVRLQDTCSNHKPLQ